jgi:hypothetical protein
VRVEVTRKNKVVFFALEKMVDYQPQYLDLHEIYSLFRREMKAADNGRAIFSY